MAMLLASSSRLRLASVSADAGRSANGASPVKSRCSRAAAMASATLAAPPEQRARRDVLQHRHLRERLHDLEGAGEAPARGLERTLRRHVLALETGCVPEDGRRTPS